MATLGMSIDMNSSFSFLSRSLNESTEELSKSLDKRINSLSRSLNESYASLDTSLSIKIDQTEDKSVGKVEKIKNKFQSLAGITNTIASNIDKVGQASDHYMAIQSRIEAINDGQQTVNELNDKIFASAGRTRTSYEDMVGIVDNLGTKASGAFSSNDEMLGFSELMVKSMKIAGAPQKTQKDVMNKLTGAMEKGKLQGDAFNSILQNTPMLAQAMADKLGVSLKTLKDMGSQGKISSGVLKSALFSSADDINSKFADVPITYGEIITRIKDMINKSLAPAFQKFSDLLNSDGARLFISNIGNCIALIVGLGSTLMNVVIGIASLFLDNWSIIAPIIWGIIAALIVYNYTILTSLFSTIMDIAAKIAHKVASCAETVAIFALIAAQDGLNAAFAACPITWIIMGVIMLIAVFYGVIAAINQFTGQSLSATGIIVGAFMVALAFIGNLFIGAYNLIIDVVCIIWNIIAAFVEFFANVFNDPIGSIIRLFANMGDAILGIIEAIASGIDTLFGTNFAEGVSGWRDDLKGMTDKLVEKQEIEIERLDPNEEHIDRLEYEKAFDYGNDIGKGIDNAVGGIFNKDIFEKDNPIDKFDQGGFDKDNMNINSVNQVNNVGSVDDTVDVSSEDLKVMRELAEIKAVENFVTLTPSVQVQTGDIKNDIDVNKVVKKIGDLLKDDIATSTKEVYALG
ncbi:hypothetical protein SH2C18_39500 [Clostridium sediminicola]|uniref:tape measure protein n=1 Tax=Clostridium sediminicola TaxID=3114879 RepID=UPI0031F2344E